MNRTLCGAKESSSAWQGVSGKRVLGNVCCPNRMLATRIGSLIHPVS